jgi:hypothetical protein
MAASRLPSQRRIRARFQTLRKELLRRSQTILRHRYLPGQIEHRGIAGVKLAPLFEQLLCLLFLAGIPIGPAQRFPGRHLLRRLLDHLLQFGDGLCRSALLCIQHTFAHQIP